MASGGGSGGPRDDEDDVELLIPVADVSPSSFSVPLSDNGTGDCSGPLLEGLSAPAELVSVGPLLAQSPGLASSALRGRSAGRDGPCEHCGMVHTARIPDACLEATAKTETSDDEALLLC